MTIREGKDGFIHLYSNEGDQLLSVHWDQLPYRLWSGKAETAEDRLIWMILKWEVESEV